MLRSLFAPKAKTPMHKLQEAIENVDLDRALIQIPSIPLFASDGGSPLALILKRAATLAPNHPQALVLQRILAALIANGHCLSDIPLPTLKKIRLSALQTAFMLYCNNKLPEPLVNSIHTTQRVIRDRLTGYPQDTQDREIFFQQNALLSTITSESKVDNVKLLAALYTTVNEIAIQAIGKQAKPAI